MQFKMYNIWESIMHTCATKGNIRATTKCPLLMFCIVFSVVLGFLLLSANLYNPTILPMPLRFSPTCKKLSPSPFLLSPPTALPQQHYTVEINSTHNNASRFMGLLLTNNGGGETAGGILTQGATTKRNAMEDEGGDILASRYSYPTPIARNYDHFNDHSWMPRFNDIETHQSTIKLLADISVLFRKHNITYTLIHGTLLGSFMFHDLIPWDDDLDILVSFKDINKVRALFRDSNIRREFGTNSYRDNYNTFAMPYVLSDADPNSPHFCGDHPDLTQETCKHTFHLYRQDSEKTLHRRIGYPYVDVQFYTENDTHVWSIDARSNDPLVYERADFYPIHMRPYFNLWQPAPHKTYKILKMKFTKFKCASKWYSHHTQTIALGYQSQCKYIMNCYPYVKRLPQCAKDKQTLGVVEQLVIGNTIIHEVVITEEYYHNLGPFEL